MVPAFSSNYGESSDQDSGRGYGSNNQRGSSNTYGSGGGGDRHGASSNSYGGGGNNWGASSNKFGGDGGYNAGGQSNYGQENKNDWAVKKESNFGSKPISNYNPESDPATIYYGNYNQNTVSRNNNVFDHGSPGGDLNQQLSGAGDLHQPFKGSGSSNEQHIEANPAVVPVEVPQSKLLTLLLFFN